ncbi:mechanosensitive ion channel family protein [Pseudomonas sp. RTC3]|uniref:mechanosensitive ion channel family protein n=1 Tax=unclassified Pseudomonas TaxID=196821 RepID=UPI002AB59466|nr:MULTISPECIES: mechanosensitive ion channel family protein [unclassified Pseudomonas]MEB0063017.1 mechanosensitive ion channel family protein [Pseudomonas sp. RTC3]MDY7566113.1 mechanosensitive ion channel family protein [Pseudomonas sp. 5C2]MEB0008443.1 mechanosensitive ion channel family protein [Pseudomonas sp. RTB2]MEB0016729.1 mechanosensitive ion channel family protein [Pseudomonas sp. RTB3]MEB0146425.1 mechanosensitive ion channel family protein [Pseudomonas sp. CCC2.2]
MDIQTVWLRTQELWGMLDQHPVLHAGLGLVLLLVVALALGRVARFVILHMAKLLGRQPAMHWIVDLLHNKLFHRLAQMVPSLVIQFGLNLVPELSNASKHFLGNVALAFTILFQVLALGALLNALLDIYARTDHARTRSIKGYVQLAKMILYIFGAIIIVATLIDRSPLLLLSGLGAMSAVILLVYKDTLLSFVASVQLTSNDMLRVGDWIEMPQVGADGDVVDITLHTVKVQNFDKTIVSIPTWRMMSESFKNWRGMQQSGGRRIKRSLFIDASGVRFVRDDEELKLTQIHLLTDYIGRKQAELKSWNEAQGNVAALSANRRRMTNIGTFRAYALAYLHSHPDIQPDMTCMVRQMQATAQGIPLEIYCFTRTTAWADYERIQGDIFDYLLAVMPEFGLSLYQQPSGMDFRAGWTGNAKSAD